VGEFLLFKSLIKSGEEDPPLRGRKEGDEGDEGGGKREVRVRIKNHTK
jgi:hypothetical protein